jgi:antitoxin ParD1/3/4
MGQIDKRSITLSPELAAAVDGAVEAGEYGSDGEVITDALREWKERRENHGYTIAELRRLVQEGIDSGISDIDGPTFMQQMRDRIDAKIRDRRKLGEFPSIQPGLDRRRIDRRLHIRFQPERRPSLGRSAGESLGIARHPATLGRTTS